MNRFWVWVYRTFFDMRLVRQPDLSELLAVRARLQEEREILLGMIAKNEQAILKATLRTGVRA